MDRVVVHHAHHPDEGVYRLVHAEAVERTVTTTQPNPAFDPHAVQQCRDRVVKAAGAVSSLQAEALKIQANPPPPIKLSGEEDATPEVASRGAAAIRAAHITAIAKHDVALQKAADALLAAQDEWAAAHQAVLELPTETVMVDETVVDHVDHQDVVWADDDECWRDMSEDKIASKQRQDVKKALAKAESADRAPEPTVIPLEGSAGQSL